MNPKVRLGLYVTLSSCMAFCAFGLLRTYRSSDPPATASAARTNQVAVTNLVVMTNAIGALQTNLLVVPGNQGQEEWTARQQSPRLGRLMAYGVTMFLAF